MKKKFVAIIFIFFLIVGCGISKKKITKADFQQAENYYFKAYAILNNTTNNALSKALVTEGLEYINSAISIDNTKSEYHRVKGSLFLHQKEYKNAFTSFERSLALNPNNSLAHMGIGIAYELTGEFKLAEKSYLKALQDQTISISVNFNLGLLYNKWGKLPKSIEQYDKVVASAPNLKSAYLNRGKVKLSLKKYEEAIKDFNKAISLVPNDKVSINNLGLALFYLKRYEEAIVNFKKALSINLGNSFDENFDTDAYAYNNMANSYFALGKLNHACFYWKEAVDFGYVYKDVWKEEYNIEDPVKLIQKHCN
ncbi:Tfp pilus assembly protein PilF [Kordia periserrulae]|uniref:Tfp pilus assembly protein PilF n=1 Tax=Kordia periserrulae TaxID=701523 RepID=A0A2T6C1N4_9FLAO|nr:tetratricopeptide repeat protein [Kordia periserrulae]PTX62228.1 Tfp pilus assembly protein PilF [Kordia periserrulae]